MNKKDDETNVINNNGIMIVLILVQVFAYTKYRIEYQYRQLFCLFIAYTAYTIFVRLCRLHYYPTSQAWCFIYTHC